MSRQSDTATQAPAFSIGGACIGFKLKRTYISDNLLLYVPPNDRFCRACFRRRYFSQMMQAVVANKIEPATLELAHALDNSIPDDNLWRAYAVKEKIPLISFDLAPYEDCPVCSTPAETTREKAALEYEQSLRAEPKPDYAGLRSRVFSFGFARQMTIDRRVGLPDARYDELMGENYAARVYSRVIDPAGNHRDQSTLGVATEEKIAEIKSVMEYLERYAFLLKVCRYTTPENDNRIIEKYLSLHRDPLTHPELAIVRSKATWAFNLLTSEVRPIPLAFIYSAPGMRFVSPSSSGFGAHWDFKQSLCRSILELIERDAFVRFWYDPARAFTFSPDADTQADVDAVLSILARAVGNDRLVSRFFVLQSPTRVPVVMVTASSADFSKPPSLCFGCGAGFDLQQALEGAIREFRFSAINLVKGVTLIDGFLTKTFSGKIEELQDRMMFYSSAAPRAKLRFLDAENPLPGAVYEDEPAPCLESLVARYKSAGLDIYAIDCTPACFRNLNVYVTRAFSTGMYPMQFKQEGYFRLESGPMSVHSELPHFFL